MIPESIRAEIEKHGGLAGAPEPQGDGTTIYRAVSGDYVVVDDASGQLRMRGFSPPADASAQQQAPAPQPASATPAPPAAVPGSGRVTQQQLEALLAQAAPNGDTRRLEFSQGTKDKTVRESDPTVAGGVVTRTVKAPYVQWVDRGTGRVLEADVESDDSYTVTKNGTERNEQGPAATTVAAAGDDKPIGSTQVTDANGKTVKKTTYQRPDGTTYDREDSVQAAPKEPEKPQVGKAYKNAQGQWVYPVTDAQGNVTTKPVPPEAIPSEGETKYGPAYKNSEGKTVQPIQSAQGQVTGAVEVGTGAPASATPFKEPEKPTIVKGTNGQPDQQAVPDPDHPGQVKYVPIPGAAGAGNRKGVPSYTPNLTLPGAGLIARAKELDELMAAGTITPEQRQEILKEDQVLASTVASEFNAGVNLLTTNFQSQASQRNVDVTNAAHRANLANSHIQNALGMVEKFAMYLGETPGDAGKLFKGLMARQLATATAYGGMKDYPRETLPAHLIDHANRATGGPGSGAAPVVPVAPQNAIGAGAVPSAVTPAAAPAAPALPSPIFRPPPAVDAVPEQPSPIETPVSQANPAIESLFGNVLPPVDPPSWHEQAQSQADSLTPTPQNIATGEQLFGSALPTAPSYGDFDIGAPVGQAPLVLQSRVPGLTPELDEIARREMMQELGAVG
jgi:hypothetical protein